MKNPQTGDMMTAEFNEALLVIRKSESVLLYGL
jgi:hypothetical protein